MKRLFIAIRTKPDKNFIRLYSSLKHELEGESIKWVIPENVHLTLVFLGDTDEDRIPEIEKILQSKCRETQNFEITLKGFGIFRSIMDPRVVWAGIYQSDRIITLHDAIADELREAGFRIEDKPFSPHVTIGRVKHIENKDSLKVVLLKYHSTEIQKVPVNEVILYESILTQEGPVYKPVSVLKLA